MKTTYEILKGEHSRGYVLLLTHDDGHTNDYRFSNKSEISRWLKKAGLK